MSQCCNQLDLTCISSQYMNQKKGNKIIGKVKDPWKTYFEAKN